jgi:hypothetical protein
VLHRSRNIHPRVPPGFVHRDLRGRKRRISKSAKRYYDHVRMVRGSPVHGRPPVRAEVKRDGLTAVTPTDVLTGSSLDLDLVSGEARLTTEGAARPPLDAW